jgi:hypothetical protein
MATRNTRSSTVRFCCRPLSATASIQTGEERQLAGCGRFDMNGLGFNPARPKEWERRISDRHSLDTLRRIKNDRYGLSCLSKTAHIERMGMQCLADGSNRGGFHVTPFKGVNDPDDSGGLRASGVPGVSGPVTHSNDGDTSNPRFVKRLGCETSGLLH